MTAENPEYIPPEAREQSTNVEYGILNSDEAASVQLNIINSKLIKVFLKFLNNQVWKE